MPDVQEILASVQKRRDRAKGIALASDYVGTISSCLGSEVCAAKWGDFATPEQWETCLKEATGRLVYRDDGMAVQGGLAVTHMPSGPALRSFGYGQKDVIARGAATDVKGACMLFDAVITTNQKDRDGDILEPAGAVVDPSHPLLWQHIPLQPIGKHLAVIGQDKNRLVGSFAIIDNELGRDVAQLVEFDALRISHGFRPIEFEPLKRSKENPQGDGWHVTKLEILETSLVSVPSNTGAVITAFSRQKLHHPLVKGWAEGLFRSRPVVVKSGFTNGVFPGYAVTVPQTKAPREMSYARPLEVKVYIGGKAPCGCNGRGRKYSEDQPRDDDGKWSAGGGGEGGSSSEGGGSGPGGGSEVTFHFGDGLTLDKPKLQEKVEQHIDSMKEGIKGLAGKLGDWLKAGAGKMAEWAGKVKDFPGKLVDHAVDTVDAYDGAFRSKFGDNVASSAVAVGFAGAHLAAGAATKIFGPLFAAAGKALDALPGIEVSLLPPPKKPKAASLDEGEAKKIAAQYWEGLTRKYAAGLEKAAGKKQALAEGAGGDSGGAGLVPPVYCTHPGCKKAPIPGRDTCEDHPAKADDCVSEKIRKLLAEGKDRDQAIAVALHVCGESNKSDPLRWNKSYGPAFDVQNEPLEPAKLEYDWLCRWIGCPVKKLFQNPTAVPSARMGSFLTGLKHALAEHSLEDVRNIRGGTEAPPEYEMVQLNASQREDFLVGGTAFYKGPRGPFAVKFTPEYYGIDVKVSAALSAKDLAKDLLDDAWRWAKENNFLKGEAFALSGEFLEHTAEGWDDVFLEGRNKKALRRVAEQMTAKGKAFANRGVILTGPPGTGKTLSGRILRNTVKGTFIWISSRDFHKAGSFGGIAFGFELARELAPSVLFIEDVDNWIDSYTADLLKTEMDGISRSSGVLTVLTTNYPENLPDALIDRPGRFHDVLRFGNPDAKARREMLTRWLPGLPAAEAEEAVRATDGYSGAHLYELAFFARTLEEADSVPRPDAVRQALAKVAEQRDLITEVQLAGSRYRPRDGRRGAGGLWLKGGGMNGTKSGRAISAKNEVIFKEVHGLFQDTHNHDQTGPPHKKLCKDAMAHTKELIGDETDKPESTPGDKAGRVLSAANMAHCEAAYGIAKGMSQDVVLHRDGRAMMSLAANQLKAVIDGAGANPGGNPNPNPGVGPEANPEMRNFAHGLVGGLLAGKGNGLAPGTMFTLKELVDEWCEEARERLLEAAAVGQ